MNKATALLRLIKGINEDTDLDTWLKSNGWKETHGIALYTNPKYPNVGVDTNSGTAAVDVFKSKQRVFNDEGAFIEFTDNVKKLEQAVGQALVVSSVFTAIQKKYKRDYESFHLTTSISAYSGEKSKVPSLTIYFGPGRIAIGVGGGYKVMGREYKDEVKYSKPTKRVADDVVKKIDYILKNFDTLTKDDTK